MRAVILALPLVAAYLGASAPAQAMFTPFDPEAASIAMSPARTTIERDMSGTMLEADFFNVPRATHDGVRAPPCSLQSVVFGKIRLARACD